MGPQPSPRRPRWLRPVAAVTIAFLLGMAARGALGTPAPRSATPPQATTMTGPGPSTTSAGMPTGYAHTQPGAQAAAVTLATTVPQRLLYLARSDVAAAVRALAATGAADQLTAAALADFDRAQPQLAAGTGTTWWAVAPLAVRVDAYAVDRARVSVWIARVLSRPGVVVPQSSWATVTVEVVWEAGDWRLWSQTSTPGPTPVLDGSDTPATAAGLDGRLAGFQLADPAPR